MRTLSSLAPSARPVLPARIQKARGSVPSALRGGEASSGRRGRPCYDGLPRPPAESRSPALLRIYNTLTRQLEPFRPRERGVVRMYVCGVTPYDVGHLGHALTFAVFDTVRRYLEFQAFEVRHIQNITDVDDDMVRVSRERGLSIADLAEQNHRVHLREMDALHVLRPAGFPRASEHIGAIVEMVEALLARGHAYEVGGHVFFSAQSAAHFGELAGRTPAELRAAPRTDSMPEEPEHLKRDPLDFLLWQPGADPGASFDSPWGAGRPGWHVECSAMARATLAEQIDIHGGGSDLVYPHHESEIAQSEGATGRRPFVGTWMHVGTMRLDGAKMSKSLGNLVKVSELTARGHDPSALRLALLSRHYRADHDFREEELASCGELLGAWRRALKAPGGPPDALRVQPWRNAFMDALDDDFDTPRAIAALSGIAEGLLEGRLEAATAQPTLRELAAVLGVELGADSAQS